MQAAQMPSCAAHPLNLTPAAERVMSDNSLYKYCDATKAIKLLERASLYLAAPDQLNDTFEAKFTSPPVREFMDAMQSSISAIALQRGETPVSFEGEAETYIASVIQQSDADFQIFCSRIGILSLAQRPNHQAMWAHYANGGKGVCLEMCFSPELLQEYQLIAQEVRYAESARIINRAEDWGSCFKELAVRHPRSSLTQLRAESLGHEFRQRWGILSTARATSIKHTDWQYEAEIRLIGPQSRTELPILSQVLRGVHFQRFDFPELAQISALLHLRYPHVEITYWTPRNGKLHPQKMKLQAYPLEPLSSPH